MTDKELKVIARAALDVAKPRWRSLPVKIKGELVESVLAAISPMLQPEGKATTDEV